MYKRQVYTSVAKIVAAGADYHKAYLTFQEFFEKLRNEPVRWGKPFAALLGALDAQLELGAAAIGGKDSMSGTFLDHDVPPTLISFAIAPVCAGELVMEQAKTYGAEIIPVDSEHSAIFQCLAGEQSPVRRLIITCSGGALRDLKREELAGVTAEQALRHPQWEMGAKITIDSSTLVNKGFEVIEAHWLFGTPAERISVLLHPQSIIHSMVEFEDGAIKAQLGTPDMRLPISFALLYPDRANRPGERFNFLNHPQLTFAEVDRAKYPALDIAYDCLRRGGTAACTMNGANEVAVAAFLARKCAWLDIVRAIRYALEHAAFVPSPTLADYAEANAEARALAAEFLQLKN